MFNRFQQGDSVQYEGDRESLKKLRGAEGTVVGRVQGEEHMVCVTYHGGDDAYLFNELTELNRYVKKEKPEGHDAKGPEVQKRRGVSGEDGRKGGKRRKGEEA
jgi:hypothetical protein